MIIISEELALNKYSNFSSTTEEQENQSHPFCRREAQEPRTQGRAKAPRQSLRQGPEIDVITAARPQPLLPRTGVGIENPVSDCWAGHRPGETETQLSGHYQNTLKIKSPVIGLPSQEQINSPVARQAQAGLLSPTYLQDTMHQQRPSQSPEPQLKQELRRGHRER